MVFNLSVLHPGGKISKFSVITIVGEPHLGANHEDFAVINDNTAIIYNVLMHGGPKFMIECKSKIS